MLLDLEPLRVRASLEASRLLRRRDLRLLIPGDQPQARSGELGLRGRAQSRAPPPAQSLILISASRLCGSSKRAALYELSARHSGGENHDSSHRTSSRDRHAARVGCLDPGGCFGEPSIVGWPTRWEPTRHHLRQSRGSLLSGHGIRRISHSDVRRRSGWSLHQQDVHLGWHRVARRGTCVAPLCAKEHPDGERSRRSAAIRRYPIGKLWISGSLADTWFWDGL